MKKNTSLAERYEKKVVDFYNRSAEQGNADSMYQLGSFYGTKENLSYDAKKSAEYYKKYTEQYSMQIQKGSVEAINKVAVIYDKGWGTTADIQKAVDYYKQAADKGHYMATKNLAYKYTDAGSKFYNPTLGYKLMKYAAECGNADAMNRFGVLNYKGEGTESNTAEFIKWISKAADASDANALYNLGQAYYYGIGVEKNVIDASNLLERAANLGNKDAEKLYSDMKNKGEI